MSIPSTAGGLIAWVFSTLIVVAVGIFIISRIPPLWRLILPTATA